MVASREKFSSQAAPELLEAVREIARKEGVSSRWYWRTLCGNISPTGISRNPTRCSWPTPGRAWSEIAVFLNCSPNDP